MGLRSTSADKDADALADRGPEFNSERPWLVADISTDPASGLQCPLLDSVGMYALRFTYTHVLKFFFKNKYFKKYCYMNNEAESSL